MADRAQVTQKLSVADAWLDLLLSVASVFTMLLGFWYGYQDDYAQGTFFLCMAIIARLLVYLPVRKTDG